MSSKMTPIDFHIGAIVTAGGSTRYEIIKMTKDRCDVKSCDSGTVSHDVRYNQITLYRTAMGNIVETGQLSGEGAPPGSKTGRVRL